MIDNERNTIEVPISLTKGAVKEILRLQKTVKENEGKALRVGVKGGGCAGFSYTLEFEEKNDNDQLYQIHGIDIIIDKSHEIYLLNTEIDFDQGLNNRGFTFKNPNAEETCGCGESFAV